MDRNQAEQIAALLNKQNELTVPYTAEKVLEDASNYIVRLDDSGAVIACAELKKVQRYQFELLHVTVAEDYWRRGFARALVAKAETIANESGARILQSTIRQGNESSEKLFAGSSFNSVCVFYNQKSRNLVRVWQKVLAPPPATGA